MAIHRADWRSINKRELERMRELRAAGHTMRVIASKTGRTAGAVSKALARVPVEPKRPAPRKPSSTSDQTRDVPTTSIRPVHVTSEPFSEQWYRECGAAFADAMRREYPASVTPTPQLATPIAGTTWRPIRETI